MCEEWLLSSAQVFREDVKRAEWDEEAVGTFHTIGCTGLATYEYILNTYIHKHTYK